MPRAKGRGRRRARPVTAQGAREAAPVVLPPIHVAGRAKVVVSAAALDGVARERLGGAAADTQRRISRFHTLTKEHSKLAAQQARAGSAAEAAALEPQIAAVSREMARLGGLDWYQRASLLGQSRRRGGDTSRWLVPRLRELRLDAQGPLRLLDVGALSCLNYARERAWIHATPIDLHAQEPGIHEHDFFDIAIGAGSASPLFRAPFDVVCLSLVVNFVGDPAKRGAMLRHAARLLVPGGHLFLVLPRPCIDNSRYLDAARLLAIMRHLGFEQRHAHYTAKLAYHLYRLDAAAPGAPAEEAGEPRFKKKLLPGAGPGMNNFSIVA
ncbi:25S rRNA (adenine2142-N1)-methyltransferase [Coemansia javaensis]|uniref:25S rRNA adenine-N(1) methyltransferase n=1 Tax=Coemansia javaensis TaxID=2761396 RepID=A0A9W8HB65_9FUNG|nr:25S rRNA (adenine2142-N1)-methyltransferase [Coemansia javaensis]